MGPSAPRRSARPGRSPVAAPSRHTVRPLTMTPAMPAAGVFGFSKVAVSAMVSGSNSTRSA
jgi:hypothetical protein